MSFSATTSARPSVQGQLKLARLLEMPEWDFEARIRELERNELFGRLSALGVVSISPYLGARFAARRFAGRELRSSAGGLPELLDGKGNLAGLIARVGQERFEECFLRDSRLSDDERGRLCGISTVDAGRLRELVDRLYVQAEFEGSNNEPGAPIEMFSSVAGIQMESGKAVLAFFNREIWKGRYRVDEKKRDMVLASLGRKEAAQANRLLTELEFLELRKSTLYRLLELAIKTQNEFLASGEQDRRKPLTQKSVAAELNVHPSVLNRLISNKSVQLPWGLEAPLKAFMPSRKQIMRNHLYELAIQNPGLSDEGLRHGMRNIHGTLLSRRSVAQYRKDLGLSGSASRCCGVDQRNYL